MQLKSTYDGFEQLHSRDNQVEDSVPLDQLKQTFFSGLESKIGGYFYKRRDANQNKIIKGFLKNYLGISYDKRYFELDVETLTIRYAKDVASIGEKLAYVEQVRNIKSVQKNVVTMSHTDKNGVTSYRKADVFDTNAKCDRGPTDGGLYHVFEIQTVHRTFTLYTEDADFLQKFVLYLERMLQLK